MQSPPQTPTISAEPTGKQQHGKPKAAGEKRLSSSDAIDVKKEPTNLTQAIGNEPGFSLPILKLKNFLKIKENIWLKFFKIKIYPIKFDFNFLEIKTKIYF